MFSEYLNAFLCMENNHKKTAPNYGNPGRKRIFLQFFVLFAANLHIRQIKDYQPQKQQRIMIAIRMISQMLLSSEKTLLKQQLMSASSFLRN